MYPLRAVLQSGDGVQHAAPSGARDHRYPGGRCLTPTASINAATAHDRAFYLRGVCRRGFYRHRLYRLWPPSSWLRSSRTTRRPCGRSTPRPRLPPSHGSSGSVPLSRISTRPEPLSRLPPPRSRAGCARCRSGEVPAKRTFFRNCGNGLNTRQTSRADGPARRSPPAPEARPTARRPVVAKSDRMTWPDCSPPTLMPVARICSTT